jgi:hypothetical protein
MRKIKRTKANKKQNQHPCAVIAREKGLKIGNPKDYVVVMGNRILDGRRSMTLEAALPEKLEPGTKLRYKRDNGETHVEVVNDYGLEVQVAFSDGNKSMVDRNHLFLPIRFSEGPLLVHKSKLHKMFGERIASLFWDSKLRMRVPPASPAKRSSSKPNV